MDAHGSGETTTDGHAPDLVIAHTSDLHLGGRYHRADELARLRSVLGATLAVGAQILILAGDIFDSNRVAHRLVDDVAEVLAGAAARIVILPGNHDPATPDAVYRRSGLASLAGLRVLGIDGGRSAVYDDLDLEVWGTPHVAYDDMSPLAEPPPRLKRRHVATAHGHWVRGAHDAHRSWLIHDEEIAATGADYVALGHWDVPQQAGDGRVAAYYSGSPEIAKTINVVRFGDRGADVRRHPLDLDA